MIEGINKLKVVWSDSRGNWHHDFEITGGDPVVSDGVMVAHVTEESMNDLFDAECVEINGIKGDFLMKKKQEKDNAAGGSLLQLGNGHAYDPTVNPGSADHLESFQNKNAKADYVITLDFPEFTSLCPVTGQPDFGNIRIEYIPGQRCVESKALKIYLFSFRNYQGFMEALTNKIFEDLDDLLSPRWMRVTGSFNPRGGIKIVVKRESES
jgi:7-cyano-7-deazaguanine reductase